MSGKKPTTLGKSSKLKISHQVIRSMIQWAQMPGYIAYIEPPLLPETLPALHAFPPLPADPPSLTAAKTTPPRIPVNAGASQAIEADQFWGPNGEAFYDPDL